MSQIIADELAILVEDKNKEINQTKSVLATQLQQLAVSKREVATVTKQLAEYSQALAAAQTDQQKAIFNQAIVALTPTLVALNNKTSGLQAAVNSTRSTLNTQQTAVANIQKQITTEEKSAGQTGPVPTDPTNATGNAAVNTTATTSPEPISSTDPTLGELGINTATIPTVSPEPINPSIDPDLISYVEPSNVSQATLYPVAPPGIDEYTEPSLISPYSVPIVPTVAPQAIDQNTEPSNSSSFNQSATGNGVTVSSILGAPGPAGFSTQGLTQQTRPDATRAAQVNENIQEDWRVRLHLAQNANYLYKDPTIAGGDILFPLVQTKGVIFPYTPAISVAYTASYPDATPAHSNYKIFQYKGSSVDQVNISCEFTAQDNSEANYLLAVIHFFRSVTKMFYGQDQNPNPGVPPPLCYLSGLGQFQFNNHALVVSGFTYELPVDVDYIRAGSPTTLAGTPLTQLGTKSGGSMDPSRTRVGTNGVPVGGRPSAPMFQQQSTYLSNSSVTYVPTKMKMSITCFPIVSRNQVSNEFSLKDYATGQLLRRGFW